MTARDDVRDALYMARNLQDWLNSNRYRDTTRYSCLENAIDPVYAQVRHIIARLDSAVGKMEELR